MNETALQGTQEMRAAKKFSIQHFSGARLAHLLRLEVMSGGNVLAGLLFSAPALYLGLGILKLLRGTGFDDWPTGWFALSNVLVVGFTSLAFARENAPQTAAFYLMVPASHLEKYAAKWLVTFALGFLGPLLALTLFSNVLAGMGALTGANAAAILLPPAEVFTSSLGTFAIAHSIFFCGSAFFKKSPLPKTLFSVAAYAFMVGTVSTAVLATGLISDEMRSTFSNINPTSIELTLGRAGLVARIAFGILCPLFLYLAAFFRLEEAEVS